jgi:hypothetical protein
MDAERNDAKVIVGLVMVLALIGIAFWAYAGDLEPSAPPAPTMKTLDEIYQAASAGIQQREGFCEYFNIAENTTETILTAQPGKRFVLLKLQVVRNSDDWRLIVSDPVEGDKRLMRGMATRYSNTESVYWIDFPDRCVTVDTDQTLKMVNEAGILLPTQVIGYFYDVY